MAQFSSEVSTSIHYVKYRFYGRPVGPERQLEGMANKEHWEMIERYKEWLKFSMNSSFFSAEEKAQAHNDLVLLNEVIEFLRSATAQKD